MKRSFAKTNAFFLFITLFITSPIQATLIKSIDQTDSFTKTITVSQSTTALQALELTPVPLKDKLVAMPTFNMKGKAFAYENSDKFNDPPAPKLQVVGGPSISYVPVVAESQTSEVKESYGSNPRVTDTAQSKTKFSSNAHVSTISLGAGISGTTESLNGISAQLTLDLKTEQQGSLNYVSAKAQGTVVDPFQFTGLAANETILVDFFKGETRFKYDVGGLDVSDMFSQLTGIIDTSDGLLDLFSLEIGVGTGPDGKPDIVISFSSFAGLGLDDRGIEEALFDSFLFDSSTSTFYMSETLKMFTLPISVATIGDSLLDPFTISYISEADTGGDPFFSPHSKRFSYDGSGLQNILGNSTQASTVPVPAPAPLALIGLGLAAIGWTRRKSV